MCPAHPEHSQPAGGCGGPRGAPGCCPPSPLIGSRTESIRPEQEMEITVGVSNRKVFNKEDEGSAKSGKGLASGNAPRMPGSRHQEGYPPPPPRGLTPCRAGHGPRHCLLTQPSGAGHVLAGAGPGATPCLPAHTVRSRQARLRDRTYFLPTTLAARVWDSSV